MRAIATPALLLSLLAAATVAWADGPGSKAEIEKKLTETYALTKTTDDKTDIVTAGSVIVLQKDKLLMVTADSAANQCPNTYKDGKLQQGGACKTSETLKKISLLGRSLPGQDKVPNTRTFVTGEKFWVTKIDVKDSGKDQGVTFEFFTDAIKDVRYKGTLTVAFKKGLPSVDDAVKLVSEVITVQPSEEAKEGSDKSNGQQGGQQQAPASTPGGAAGTPGAAQPPAAAEAPPAPVEAPPPAIEAPPPPAPDPVTVSLGQTVDQVVAALGQPTKKAKVGTKEIYYYKDLKVTFINGKVKDVE
jgi:hypothetical protein